LNLNNLLDYKLNCPEGDGQTKEEQESQA